MDMRRRKLTFQQNLKWNLEVVNWETWNHSQVGFFSLSFFLWSSGGEGEGPYKKENREGWCNIIGKAYKQWGEKYKIKQFIIGEIKDYINYSLLNTTNYYCDLF